MQLLLKNVTIIDADPKLNRKKRDILIIDGIIEEIKSKIEDKKAVVFNAKEAYASIGWMDIGTQVGDPGFEHREDLKTAERAALAGGYSAIAPLPNTNPAIHSKSEVNYICNNTWGKVTFYPLGAVSRDCAGKDLTEMYDMHDAGAVAFTDGQKTIQDSGLMMRALQYVKAFDGLVMNHPHDKSIAGDGQVHEGIVSISLGMKGIPSLAEELMVRRDLDLAEYTESRLHLSNISTAGAVQLVKEARLKGINVTASVPVMNLAFDDQAVMEFDTHFKVMPPLREKADIKALKKALKDGTIDLISSNHTPLDEEAKNLEFPYADFGIIGLETTFALCNTYLKSTLSTEELVKILSVNPRKILKLPVPEIKVGASADLTIFNTNEEWVFKKKHIHSKSQNTPFVGTTFTGKVLGVINNGDAFFPDFGH